MKLDFSPLKDNMNHMALQLAIILVVPLILGLVIKGILKKIKFPNSIANFISTLCFLYAFYKMVLNVLG